MGKNLVIIGAGGHGKVAAECAELMGLYTSICFWDGLYPQLTQVSHWPVVGTGAEFSGLDTVHTDYFVAIGHNITRQKVTTQLLEQQCHMATLIHPSAVVSPYSEIGEGTLICATAVVNIETKIAPGCIVNTGASVDHDNILASFVHIAPGARLAGSVSIGEASFIGIGSVIIPGKSIGKHCVLGAGSTLLHDLADYSVAVGSPAKVIKQK
jgi:UDP-N-acetylbacillosamine N-acetyltransferase